MIRRGLRLLVLVAVAAGAAFGLVTWAGQRAAFRPGTSRQPLATGPAASVNLPAAPYAAVDPALIPALQASGPYADPLTTIAEGIPPIGIYLPMTGNTQFELPAPTAAPALGPLPTPTVTPTPTAAPPSTFTPAPIVSVVAPSNCAPSGWPAPGVLTQYFHWYHRAIDIGVPLNTAVVATHSGQVVFAGWRTDGYGNLIIIQSGRFITYYAHLTDFAVSEGQVVAQGAMIGWSGSTGNSTGPHIHYEIRIDDSEVDPLTFENRGHPTC